MSLVFFHFVNLIIRPLECSTVTRQVGQEINYEFHELHELQIYAH